MYLSRSLFRTLSLAALLPSLPMPVLSAVPQLFQRRRNYRSNSRYAPHQGKRECARRLRQMAKIASRQA